MSNFDPTEEHVAQVGAGFTDMLSTIEKIKGDRYAGLCRSVFGLYNYRESVHTTMDIVAGTLENSETLLAASAVLKMAISAVINDNTSTIMDAIINPNSTMDKRSEEYKIALKNLHADMTKDLTALFMQQQKLDNTTVFPSGMYDAGAQG